MYLVQFTKKIFLHFPESFPSETAALCLVVSLLSFLSFATLFLNELTALLAYIFYLFPLIYSIIGGLASVAGVTCPLPLSWRPAILPVNSKVKLYTMPIMHRL
jgi:hypothetical protein